MNGRREKGESWAYLTDNVVIVRQVVSVSLGSGRWGVAQFPYVWLRAVGCCGNREAVRLRLAALWAVLTAGEQTHTQRERERDLCDKYLQSFFFPFKRSVRLYLSRSTLFCSALHTVKLGL